MYRVYIFLLNIENTMLKFECRKISFRTHFGKKYKNLKYAKLKTLFNGGQEIFLAFFINYVLISFQNKSANLQQFSINNKINSKTIIYSIIQVKNMSTRN